MNRKYVLPLVGTGVLAGGLAMLPALFAHAQKSAVDTGQQKQPQTLSWGDAPFFDDEQSLHSFLGGGSWLGVETSEVTADIPLYGHATAHFAADGTVRASSLPREGPGTIRKGRPPGHGPPRGRAVGPSKRGPPREGSGRICDSRKSSPAAVPSAIDASLAPVTSRSQVTAAPRPRRWRPAGRQPCRLRRAGRRPPPPGRRPPPK